MSNGLTASLGILRKCLRLDNCPTLRAIGDLQVGGIINVERQEFILKQQDGPPIDLFVLTNTKEENSSQRGRAQRQSSGRAERCPDRCEVDCGEADESESAL